MMECVREETSHRRRHRPRVASGSPSRSQTDVTAPDPSEVDSVERNNCGVVETDIDEHVVFSDTKIDNASGCEGITESVNTNLLSDLERDRLKDLNTRLDEQEEVFKTEAECVDSKKQATKERISAMFEQFRELMLQKEAELLDKVDREYTITGTFLNDSVDNIKDDKQKVSALLEIGRSADQDISSLEIEHVNEDVDTSVNIRNDILEQFRVPYFVFNEQSLETFKALEIGKFEEYANAVVDHTEGENTASQENDTGANNTETNELITETVVGAERNTEREANSEQNGAEASSSAEDRGEVRHRENCSEKEATLGATGTSETTVTPSAPPIGQGEAPPPYWQAMGLQGPQEHPRSQNEIPGYFEIPHSPSVIMPENKPELFHSFPIRRQYDRRGPLPVALTWNHERICIADKANMSVKFLFPNGQLITEMHFGGTELHDIAFLEELHGESRYVLSSPKSKALMIIGIDSQNTPKVIRKFTFTKQYSCVCRGPKVQTLLGSVNGSRSVVYMFSFAGNILLTLTHTPGFVFFQHIKSVQTTGNNILVLDWKLNSLSVFQDDGTAVGEYKGTANFPLIHPLDMTLDNQGNILILNGEFSNIHVVDLRCNSVEIIQLPRNMTSSTSGAKLVAFDLTSRRLATSSHNGEIAVFTFQNGYDALPQRNLAPNIASPNDSTGGRRVPEVLPLVEGMLPSTIEDIISRQPVRNRSRQFHL